MATCAFGPFRLDSTAGQLRRGEAVVPLAPKAFTVLEHLAGHPGQLITKDDLLELAWADVHVGDGALKVCIREIRRALGDDPRAPSYIETAHRRGYRFIAPVSMEPMPIPAATTLTPTPGHAAVSVLEVPETHYARSGDVNIAYQVVGDGPGDLVFVMGWVSHLDYLWAEPSFARFLHRLSSFSRLILIDKRGTGLRLSYLHARAADGRRPRGHGTGRVEVRGAARRVGRRPDVRALCRHVSREDTGARDDRDVCEAPVRG
jgi:DNA-binding winged helix-turn-helix (wHTH) protein